MRLTFLSRALPFVALAALIGCMVLFLLVQQKLKHGPPADPLHDSREADRQAQLEGMADRPDGGRASAPVALPSHPVQSDCLIVAQVIDERGLGLAGVEVHLSSYGPWLLGIELPQVPSIDDTFGWATRTDAAGNFRFQVPAPTASIQMLWIEPGSFHERRVIHFGSEGEYLASLIAGSFDLGPIRLTSRGTVRGTVRDVGGRPLSNVQVILEDHESSLDTSAWTDANGDYQIDHAALGRMAVHASHDEFVRAVIDSIEIRAGEVTENVDFTLVRAPTIRGVVVDESAAPIENARVRGRALDGTVTESRMSRTDGTFCLALPDEQSYALRASMEGYSEIPSSEGEVICAPGSSEARLVLKTLPTRSFLVVDARTDIPIESFGSRVMPRHQVRDYGGNLRRHSHPGGRIDLGIFSGATGVAFESDGYREQRVRFGPGAARDEVTRVLLVPAPAVTGCILLDKSPVGGIEVRLQGGLEDDEDAENPRFESEGEPVRTRTDARGRFRFSALPANRDFVRLGASGPRGSVIDMEPFQLSGDDVDLGDLFLVAGASVTGRVLAPPGRSPSGLVVVLDSSEDWREMPTDFEGRFQFDGLRSGQHEIGLKPRLGLLEQPQSQHLILTTGQRADVIIDARAYGTCPVSLTIRVDSQPRAGIEVWLDPVAIQDSPEKSVPVKSNLLGNTDANGRVQGYALACGRTWVRIAWKQSGEEIQATTAIECQLDRRVDATLDFELGALEVRLPSSMPEGQELYLDCRLRQLDAGGNVEIHHAVQALDSMPPSQRFEPVFAGSFLATVEVMDRSAEPVETTLADGTVTERIPAISRLETTITIAGGKTTVLQLP